MSQAPHCPLFLKPLNSDISDNHLVVLHPLHPLLCQESKQQCTHSGVSWQEIVLRLTSLDLDKRKFSQSKKSNIEQVSANIIANTLLQVQISVYNKKSMRD